jgi:sulfur carrier protein ThiS
MGTLKIKNEEIKMKIYIEKIEKQKEIKFEGTVKELLKKLKINEHTVMVTNNKKILELKDKVEDSDEIKLIDVVMGG